MHNERAVEFTPAPRPLPAHARDPWRSFLRSMFWIGINSFGGPVAQIGVMHQEAVDKHQWLTHGEFMHLLNFANILPGPEALEIVIHLGYLRRGVLGGIAAGLLFIWPGFVTLTTLAWLYSRYGNIAWVSGFFSGIRPVAVALITFAAIRLSAKALNGLNAYLLMAAAFVASFFFGLQFLVLLASCGLIGTALAHRETVSLKRWQLPVSFTLLALALAAGFVASPRQGGREPNSEITVTHKIGWKRQSEIAWVNTKAALATFGGAYTVLPYLREQMVDTHHWVTNAQVADALALGETTPGPLISFGIFLSYLAGGFWGAVTSCIFLFLPSFVLVLILGRYISYVENLPYARAFLWGVSAGTIGLILSMSAQIVPFNINGMFEAAIAVFAFIALWRFKANIILTVICGGLLGITRIYLGVC
jgi:chromate transporter